MENVYRLSGLMSFSRQFTKRRMKATAIYEDNESGTRTGNV